MNLTFNHEGVTDAVESALSFLSRNLKRFGNWIGGPSETMSDITMVRLKFWHGVKELEPSGKFEFHYDSPDLLLAQQVADEYEAAGWRVMGCLTWLSSVTGDSYALCWIEVRAPHRREDLYQAREAVKSKIPDDILNPKRSWLNRLRGAA